MILAGLSLAFLGWLLYDAVITFVGSVLGGAVGVGISFLVLNQFDLQPPWTYISIALGLVVGIIGGVLLFRYLNKMAFFWMGTIIGGWFVWTLFNAFQPIEDDLNMSMPVAIALKAILALVIGVICLWMRRTFVIIMTAMAGSLLFCHGLSWLSFNYAGLIIFPIGLVLQWKWSKKKRKTLDE